MPEPLTYAGLEAATEKLLCELCIPLDHPRRELIRLTLTSIAKRALEWAAMTDQAFHPDSFDRYVSESPRVLLSKALAALDAPDTETPKGRTVPLTDAEVLEKLPLAYCVSKAASGKSLTTEQFEVLIEKLRWA